MDRVDVIACKARAAGEDATVGPESVADPHHGILARWLPMITTPPPTHPTTTDSRTCPTTSTARGSHTITRMSTTSTGTSRSLLTTRSR